MKEAVSPIEFERRKTHRSRWSLASETGIYPQRLARIELGKVKPRDEELKKISKALGLSVKQVENMIQLDSLMIEVVLLITDRGIEGRQFFHWESEQATFYSLQLYRKIVTDLDSLDAKIKKLALAACDGYLTVRITEEGVVARNLHCGKSKKISQGVLNLSGQIESDLRALDAKIKSLKLD